MERRIIRSSELDAMVEFNPHVNGINHEELNRYLAMTPTERYEEFLVRDQAVTKYLEDNNLELEIECEYFPTDD